MMNGTEAHCTSHSKESGQSNSIRSGGRKLYEKWDHGVTTINEIGRKVYKKFHSQPEALGYMHKLLAKGKWAIYWDRSRSPNFYYPGLEIL